MPNIKVVNKYHLGNRPTRPPDGVKRVTVMRGTPLGNPFPMKDSSQEERNRVCDSYEEWLTNHLRKIGPELNEFNRLLRLLESPDLEVLELVCCCAPKRCHADTIKQLLEQAILEDDSWF